MVLQAQQHELKVQSSGPAWDLHSVHTIQAIFLASTCMTGIADTGASASYAPQRDKEVELIPGNPLAQPLSSCASITLMIVHWTLSFSECALAVRHSRLRNKIECALNCTAKDRQLFQSNFLSARAR